MMARPIVITDEIAEKITDLVGKGVRQIDIANELGISIKTIGKFISRNKIQSLRRKWPDSHFQFIRENYPQKSVTEIAKALNRSENAIYQKLFELGLSIKYPKFAIKRSFTKHNLAKNINKIDPFKDVGIVSDRRIKTDELIRLVLKKRKGQKLINERFVIKDINDAFGGGIHNSKLNKTLRALRSQVKTIPICNYTNSIAYDFSQVASNAYA